MKAGGPPPIEEGVPPAQQGQKKAGEAGEAGGVSRQDRDRAWYLKWQPKKGVPRLPRFSHPPRPRPEAAYWGTGTDKRARR